MEDCLEEKNPYIYVLCKGSRIEGEFYGVFIDATQNIEEIEDEIEKMLEESPSSSCNGEWIIDEYYNFCGIDDDLLGSEPPLDVVIRVARFIVDTQWIRENCQCFDSYYDSIVKYTKRAIKECAANMYEKIWKNPHIIYDSEWSKKVDLSRCLAPFVVMPQPIVEIKAFDRRSNDISADDDDFGDIDLYDMLF